MDDVRLAIRSLRAAPIVSAVAVLSLALGIGANTAIFSLVNSLLLRQLPVRDARALVLVTDPTSPGVRAYAYAVWDAFHRYVDVFDGLLAWSPAEFNLAPRGEAQLVSGAWVSGSYFDTPGVRPVLGRVLAESDDRPGGGPDGAVAVISHGLWQRSYGGAADVIGRTLMLDGAPFIIVGVTPPRFAGLEPGRTADVIAPFGAAPVLQRGGNLQVTIMARLRAGQSLDAATVALRRLQPQVREASLPRASNWRQRDLDAYLRDGFVLVPGATGSSRLRLRYERPLLILMAVVALVLLIACANVANLLLARAAARQRELQVRMALGASRWRLMRGMLVESAVIAAVGAAAGMLMASWASRLVVQQLSTSINPIALDLSPDASVAIFTVVVTCAVTLLFGMAPAIRASRVPPAGALNSGRSSFSDRRSHGPSGALIVTQVALSVVLVVGAGLFLGTFSSLMAVPLGFEPERVLMASVSADAAHAPADRRLQLFERVRDAVRAVPGVADAAFSFLTPVAGPILLRPIEVADRDARSERDRLSSVNLVSPGWFRTLGTPIVAGREFTDADAAGAPSVVIVNRAFARRFLRADNPIGGIVTVGIVGPNAGSAEVVGLVGDAVYASLREPAPPTMYFPLAQLRNAPPASLTLTVRTEAAAPMAMARSVAAAVGSVNPEAALAFRPLTNQIEASVAQERVLALLSGFFGGLAVLLAALGLFGVTSYSVNRARREIGIRMALGAAPSSVLRLVLGRVVLLVGAGVAIGIVVSLWATRFTTTLVFGLEARDPLVPALSAALLLGVGLLAALPPAWRASHVDPSVVLRAESL
jgi:putative ABC transport system permease protein